MIVFNSALISVMAAQSTGLSFKSTAAIPVVLWVTGFLCVLNVALAIFYRRNKRAEVVSYYAAFAFELVLFVAALLVLLHVISQSFFRLPAGLPINQGEIGIALAIGLGLFPAAYWHRINISELPKRITEDGKNMKNNQANVRVRDRSIPGEWMN
ncbi:hypothetical protein [Dictyobacter kobayashii]|uniref:Uncharacterized protein n=1 Tax=Dictyobacter kobayashii TaxID=2014872 RepID=A0A402AFI1_9CHLR|nr:hypothetical protein [Dictyobacter kobayashii]GCE17859.1 hypothetical protein KDK_16590 [Dictyobacter kobayashii]